MLHALRVERRRSPDFPGAGGRRRLQRLLFALIAMGCAAVGYAQDAGSKPQYIGVTECARCHEKAGTLDEQSGATKWVRLDEFHVWFHHDKHAQAFKLLESDLGRRIGELLNLGDVTKRAECLSCHCDQRPGGTDLGDFNRQQGVSCESCHGPGEKYEKLHRVSAWRKRSAAEKFELGMVDVRDPRKRTRQCLSCHLGNVEQGKILTHEMYAAGHPPLPGFEVETFAQSMPAHWRYLEEKDESVRNDADIKKLLGYRNGDLHGVKSVVIGGVESLRVAIRLVQAQAENQSTKGGWPEFAQFDCAMCHHDLQAQSWRQQSPPRGKPGLPGLRAWPGVLVELAIRHAHRGSDETAKKTAREFQVAWGQFHDQFTARPFVANRKPTKLDQARAQLDELVETLSDQLEQANYDRPAAAKLLRDLCELGNRPGHDYDSARQIAWAFKAIYDAASRVEPFEHAAAIGSALDELGTALHLELPATQAKQILDELSAALEASAKYDPTRIRAIFAEMATRLSANRKP